jgi:hypothetical protein
MSTDDMRLVPPGDSHTNCLLSNLPAVPTKKQLETLDGIGGLWFCLAAVAPFVILALIGGWGETFQSGDASAYILGAIVVCVAESIFQQKDDNFATLKRYWSKSSHWGPRYSVSLSAFGAIVLFTWNMYFAIHDRHVGTPSVDWVQILIFCIALFSLPGIRFTATPYSGEEEWTDTLRKRIEYLHSKATRFVQEAEKYQLDDPLLKGYSKLEIAEERFKDIDDLWCASQAHNRSLELEERRREAPVSAAIYIWSFIRDFWH